MSKLAPYFNLALAAMATTFAVIIFVLSVSPVRAAQTDVALWDFEDQDLVVDMLYPQVPSASLTAGPGLSSPSFQAGNPPSANWSLQYSSWSTSGCGADDYLEYALDMSNLGGVNIRFDERRSATGPENYEIHYSVDGGGFTPLSGANGATSSNFGSNPMHAHTINSGSADYLAMQGQANVRFRVYGCNSGGNGGKWEIDNFVFSATSSPTTIGLKTISVSNGAFGWRTAIIFLTCMTMLSTFRVLRRFRR